jgi:hypothetical protein
LRFPFPARYRQFPLPDREFRKFCKFLYKLAFVNA